MTCLINGMPQDWVLHGRAIGSLAVDQLTGFKFPGRDHMTDPTMDGCRSFGAIAVLARANSAGRFRRRRVIRREAWARDVASI
jgi:hypothetical protein